MKISEFPKSSKADEDASPNLCLLLIIGFAVTIIGLILVTAATAFSQSGSSSFGGIIFIGPIPIVFGSGPGAQWLILFAMILAALSVLMLLTLRRKPYSTKG